MGNEYNLGILCDYGYGSTAWRVITNTDHPSLLYMLSTYIGGTTTESWIGYTTASGTSMNHYSVGCLSRWFFEHLGGIKITSPGFATVQIKPYMFEKMGDCNVTYKTDGGLLASSWVYDENNKVFEWKVTVPAGVKATVTLPTDLEFVGDNSVASYEVTEGVYKYTVKRSDSLYLDVDTLY